MPQDHPVNKDFVDNLDRVNAIAEAQPGFVWRFQGEGNNAMDVQTFEDPNIIVNMSVWENISSLFDFVYKAEAHQAIMRRKKEWFEKVEFHMVLWWVEAGLRPNVEEGKLRLESLKLNGPTYSAFTFKKPFPAPSD